MSMHTNLKWLAENVSEWPRKPLKNSHSIGWNGSNSDDREPDYIRRDNLISCAYTKSEWLQARQELGLDNTETPEEKEEWDRIEARQVAKHSKYHREIKPGVWVDVYDVLHAWCVTNPALQHLIKKALQPGERGHKTREQDMKDIVASALRAGELGE